MSDPSIIQHVKNVPSCSFLQTIAFERRLAVDLELMHFAYSFFHPQDESAVEPALSMTVFSSQGDHEEPHRVLGALWKRWAFGADQDPNKSELRNAFVRI